MSALLLHSANFITKNTCNKVVYFGCSSCHAHLNMPEAESYLVFEIQASDFVTLTEVLV